MLVCGWFVCELLACAGFMFRLCGLWFVMVGLSFACCGVYFIVCVLGALRAFGFVRDLVFGDVGCCLK